MDIEQQFKEYLIGKLKRLMEETGQATCQITVKANDFFPGKLRVTASGYTKLAGHSDDFETIEEAIAETLRSCGVESLAEQAASLRATAASMLAQAEQIEALS